MRLVVTLTGLGSPQRINIELAEETPGALEGLGILTEPVEVEFKQPMVVLGARIEGVN
jgi:hypothetical protein